MFTTSTTLFVNIGVNFQSVSEDGVEVEIKNIGSNTGQFQSTIEVKASLDTVWNILTDYEHFADVVPCVSASKLLEKKANTSRVHQVGAVNLLLGMKFKAKAVVDYTEKEVEIDPNGKKRCLEFKMIEGDFQVYEGKWCIEQVIMFLIYVMMLLVYKQLEIE